MTSRLRCDCKVPLITSRVCTMLRVLLCAEHNAGPDPSLDLLGISGPLELTNVIRP